MSIFKEAIQINAPGKSKFDLSHEKKLTFDMGRLVPIYVQETLPGDSFRVETDFLIRVPPMLAPLFHRVDVYTHYFFVPNRIIWNEWELFLTGGTDGLQAPVHPQIDFAGTKVVTGSLMDYMGLPSDDVNNWPANQLVNALPFRAYQEIYNEYYRDENLIPKQVFSKNSGIFTAAAEYQLIELKKRAWAKGYFNTALPFAQRGNPAAAPVDYSSMPTHIVHGTGSNLPPGTNAGNQVLGTDVNSILTDDGTKQAKLVVENEASVLITELRKAARLQEFLEAAARGGARLTEWILHVFGVKSSDARVQRPEYLGGGRSPLQISEVLSNFQFSGDAEGKPQGNMAGHAIATSANSHGFSYSCEEHGFIIGIMSVMPQENFYQGLEKMWQRPTRFDYYIPQFAHLGEQEVKNKEVFLDYTGANNEETFGYQSRYAEYKFRLSTIHGNFRDDLAYWHMARKFAATPGLNQTFIECEPTKDIFAVPTEPALLCNIWNDVSAVRPLPYFSNPKL